ncbi:MAG: ABC transporter permease [Planctomycetota bacterium]
MVDTFTAAWALAQKDLRSFLRDRTALVLSILVPIALVTVFGWIMTYAFGGSGSMPKVRLQVADFSQSANSQEFVEALEGTDMLRIQKVKFLEERFANVAESGTQVEINEADVREQLEQLVRDGDASHILVIPSDFEDQIDSDQVPRLDMLRDPGRQMENQIIQIAVIQASMTAFGGNVFTDGMDRILSEQGMDPKMIGSIRSWMTDIDKTIEGFYEDQGEDATAQPDENVTDNLDSVGGSELADRKEASAATQNAPSAQNTMNSMMEFMQELVPIETTDIAPPARGKQVTYQRAQSVAGMTVMMLLFALTSCGSVLLSEREEGTLKRLFAQPITRNAVLLGKFLFVLMVGLGQMAILFTYGEWMFGVGLFRDPVTLFVLSISWVACGGAFGMFLAAVSRSSKQAESLASLLILVMAALGGCWFPIQNMNLPAVLETVCKSTLTYWSMTGFQSMLWYQLSWMDDKVLLALAWQWGWAIVLTLAAAFFFRQNYCRG